MENPIVEVQTQETALQTIQNTGLRTMWNDTKLMQNAWKMATVLANSDVVPDSYRGKVGNCLIAIDIGNRVNLSPITIMQASQVVKGNFTWKGSACKAMIDGCGKFKYSEYIISGEPGTPEWACFLQAIHSKTGRVVRGPAVTWQMALDEGWVNKAGSKWKTMPEVMMRYRSAAFFSRTECPEVLMGFQTSEEYDDVNGTRDEKEKITITL